MLKSNFFLNPARKLHRLNRSYAVRFKYRLRSYLINLGLWLGFNNVNYSYIHGDKARLELGNNCSTMNSLFNVISGHITIGDDTIMGHNCMFLTGTHQFHNGMRASFQNGNYEETPNSGRDIIVGEGCFIGSGAIVVGPVTIGNNVIIGAGSVVSKDIPDSCFAAGVPAKVIKNIA